MNIVSSPSTFARASNKEEILPDVLMLALINRVAEEGGTWSQLETDFEDNIDLPTLKRCTSAGLLDYDYGAGPFSVSVEISLTNASRKLLGLPIRATLWSWLFGR